MIRSSFCRSAPKSSEPQETHCASRIAGSLSLDPAGRVRIVRSLVPSDVRTCPYSVSSPGRSTRALPSLRGRSPTRRASAKAALAVRASKAATVTRIITNPPAIKRHLGAAEQPPWRPPRYEGMKFSSKDARGSACRLSDACRRSARRRPAEPERSGRAEPASSDESGRSRARRDRALPH